MTETTKPREINGNKGAGMNKVTLSIKTLKISMICLNWDNIELSQNCCQFETIESIRPPIHDHGREQNLKGKWKEKYISNRENPYY